MKRILGIVLMTVVLASSVWGHGAKPPAPDTAPHQTETAPVPSARVPVPAGHHESSKPHLVGWLGRLHPFVVHFPIAFLLGAAVAEVLARRRPEYDSAAGFLVVASGVTAPIAAAFGLIDAWGQTWSSELSGFFWAHRAFGILSALLALGAAVLRPRSPYAFLLGGAVVAVLITGFLGAALVHGPEHFLF